jgi:hypothetical protein
MLRESTCPASIYQASAMRYEAFVQARKEYVTSLAHQSWILRGCPEGSPEVDWFSAELKADQEILGELELGLPA